MEVSTAIEPGLFINHSDKEETWAQMITDAPADIQKGFSDTQWYRKVMFIIQAILCIITIIINPLTLVAIVKYKKLKRLLTNIFIFSLTTANSLGGFVNLSLFLNTILRNYGVQVGFGIFWWQFAFGTVSMYSFIFSVTAITIERAIATLRPHSYKTILTHGRGVAAVVLMWIINFLFIGSLMLYRYFSIDPSARGRPLSHHSQMFPDNVFISVIMPIIYIAMAANVLLYLVISRAIIVQGKKVGDVQRQDKAARNNRKVTKMASLVVILMIITWTPQFVEVSIPYPDRSQFKLYHLRTFISHLTQLLILTNPILNCIVYAWHNNHYREAYKKLLGIEKITGAVDQETS